MARSSAPPSCLAITGASSGLGRALAVHYAAPGRTLLLIARDADRLRETEALCRERGAQVRAATIDVRDRDALAGWLRAADRMAPVDGLIANAGVMGGLAQGDMLECADTSRAIIDTNFSGVLNTVQPMLPLMLARRRGQIAILSSIAGFIPLPDAPSYGASKAALVSYGLALRASLAGTGLRVNVIAPGFVATPMTAQESGWQPFRMPADAAARRIARGLAADRALITFPWLLSALTRIGGALPDRLRVATQAAFRFRVRANPSATEAQQGSSIIHQRDAWDRS